MRMPINPPYRAASTAAPLFAPVRAALANGHSAVICLLGDSTGNSTDEWFYRLLSEKIGPEISGSRIVYRLWDDASQAYGALSTIQAGSGERRHIVLNGSTSYGYMLLNQIKTAASADLEAEFSFAMTDWTPSAAARIGGISGAGGNRGWYLQISTTGLPQFVWSADGTAIITETGTATGFTDGAEGRIRVKLDVDNGAGGYTINIDASSDGGASWSSLLNKATAAGTTSIFATTGPNVEFGRAVGSNYWAGKAYEMIVRDGIGGPNRLPASIEEFIVDDVTTTPLGGAPTLYVFNGSHAGAGLSYLGDTTRLPKMLPWAMNELVFLSTRHNDSSVGIPTTWSSTWSTFLTNIRSRAPNASIVAVNQNPRYTGTVSGKTTADLQAQMARAMPGFLSRHDVPVIDTYSAYDRAVAAGATLADLVTDGVHPVASAGVNVWLEEVWKSLR